MKISLNFKTIIALITSIILTPYVSAQSNMDLDLPKVFETIFGREGLGGILQSDYGVYGITLIFYYLIFYGIMSAGLKKVKIFEGEGNIGLNLSGKILAHAFSGLMLLAIFAYLDPRQDNIFNILAIFGIYGQLLIIIIIFYFTYKFLTNDR